MQHFKTQQEHADATNAIDAWSISDGLFAVTKQGQTLVEMTLFNEEIYLVEVRSFIPERTDYTEADICNSSYLNAKYFDDDKRQTLYDLYEFKESFLTNDADEAYKIFGQECRKKDFGF